MDANTNVLKDTRVVYGEVDNIKLGKTLFPNWHHILSEDKKNYCKKSPWSRGRYAIIVEGHFIAEFW